jgi:hypothetical protein
MILTQESLRAALTNYTALSIEHEEWEAVIEQEAA